MTRISPDLLFAVNANPQDLYLQVHDFLWSRYSSLSHLQGIILHFELDVEGEGSAKWRCWLKLQNPTISIKPGLPGTEVGGLDQFNSLATAITNLLRSFSVEEVGMSSYDIPITC